MSGTSVYKWWVQKYGVEEADRRMAKLKTKQSANSSGRNNSMYGKPSPSGSGNGWKGWYKGWFFRSLRELSYVINVLEKNNSSWKTAEAASLKIPYIDPNGTERTYVADFLVGNTLIEVKPRRLLASRIVQAKASAARIFCEARGMTYIIEDAAVLPDDEIRQLYTSGVIKFTPRYDRKFQERYAL
jgi:hypothetical protein